MENTRESKIYRDRHRTKEREKIYIYNIHVIEDTKEIKNI